jgi:all-trans-8'-apo-beta-carotenal 15,15'-oxygenase
MHFSRRDFITTSAAIAGVSAINPFGLYAATSTDQRRLSYMANRSASFVGKKKNLKIKGELPSSLRGTYLKNGPGLKELYGSKFDHYFDGDALITKFHFHDGQVDFENAFIDTPERLEEQAKQRMIFDEFGTAAPTRRLQGRKNQPNISLLNWQEQLYAFSEGGHPVILDSKTLAYIETSNFNNGLPKNVSFTAHPKVDPKTGDLYGVGIYQGITMAIKVFRVDAQTKKATELYSFPQRQVAMIHDFIITDDKIIIVVPSASFRLIDLARGVRPLSKALQYRSQQETRVIVLGKNQKKVFPELQLPPSMLFHHGPAYEKDDQLIMHSCVAEDGKLLNTIAKWRKFPPQTLSKSYPNLVRYAFDLKSSKLIEEKTLLENHDFPTHNPRHHGRAVKNIYAVRMGQDEDPMAFSGISKLDLLNDEIFSINAPLGEMSSEAVYVENPDHPNDEERGWLMYLSYSQHLDQTSLEIVNSSDLSFVAQVQCECFVPLGFHGLFQAEN